MRIPQPQTEAEAASSGRGAVWRIGTYDFECHDAADDVSKGSGEDMIKLTLYVFNDQGDKRTVYDYLPSSAKAQWKVRSFAKSVGLIADYEAGELNCYDIVGKTGKLKLGIKRAQGEYSEDNLVTAYVEAPDMPERAPRPAARPAAPAQTRQPTAAQRATADLNDEIPF